jgi:hypothetical protein
VEGGKIKEKENKKDKKERKKERRRLNDRFFAYYTLK